MSKNNYSFQYKWEKSEPVAPSTLHSEKDYTMLTWLIVFMLGFLSLFFLGYRKNLISEPSVKRKIQSLHQVGMEPFLVRVSSSEGMILKKVRVQFFVEDIVTQNQLREEKDQYKEHLIFFLSNAQAVDFIEKDRRQALTEKIKNHINSFLSEGKIQHVVIENQSY